MNNKRIVGLDVARAIAIIGMIIVNFKMVIGATGNWWASPAIDFLSGKAAATFVVLAGIGLALVSNDAIVRGKSTKLRLIKLDIAKRAVLLFVLGLSYMLIWPADILHFYGVYMLVTLLFLTSRRKWIFVAIVVSVLIYPLLMFLFPYEIGWDFTTLDYHGFWTVNGFIRNLLYNGFHPVLPWVSFMLLGLWYGKQDLRDINYIRKSWSWSLIIFLTTSMVSLALTYGISSSPNDIVQLSEIFGMNPMPPLPIYMIGGSSIAILVISSCILVSLRYQSSVFISMMQKTGKLALTFYVSHVIIGMASIEYIDPQKLGEYSLKFSVGYAIVFSVLCSLFAVVWLRYFKLGPLEWIFKKLVNYSF